MNRNDDAFDARLRDTWRSAVDAVPPALAWRLRSARTPTPARRAPMGWPLGAAFAAAAVLALAVGLRPHPAALPSATTVAASAGNADDATALLDRNPDFYAWLASPDAEQLAME
ncbi:MAG: hypothetical protein QM719_03945 [Thermomonas sp.]